MKSPIILKEKERKRFLSWSKSKEDGYRGMLARLEEAEAPEDMLRDIKLKIASFHITSAYLGSMGKNPKN